jgi:hypothetical protein
MLKRSVLLSVVLLLAAALTAAASVRDMEKAVEGLDDGYVRMTFAAREGVCGDGWDSIRIDGSWYRSHCHGDDWERDCEEGPVRVSLKVRDGDVVDIRTRVGGRWRKLRDDVLDLGEVDPQDAADFLLDLVEDARGSLAEDALMPAILGRNVVVWPRFMQIARDDGRSEDIRGSAVFWLGVLAGEKATEGLIELVEDDDEDLDVRKTAVFALSQGRRTTNTHHLIKIARTNPHPQLRKSAMFWLAQRDDPEVLDFFEEILLGKN